MKLFALVICLLGAVPACTSDCDNGGVAVDDRGNIIVRGESGFISPNSSILRNVRRWPQPPSEEQSFAFSQGYTLARDGAMYVLENTEQHPNLVYHIDLASGTGTAIGQTSGSASRAGGALRSTNETWIAANDRYVYSVNQRDPLVSRADLLTPYPRLRAFIAGSRTRLVSPIGVVVDEAGRLCALDGETHLVLCYAPNQSGNVAPARAIDLRQLLGIAVPESVAFDREGRIVVSGARSANGFSDSVIAVLDARETATRVVRTIAGSSTGLLAPDVAVDARGDILALQQEAPTVPSASVILGFAPPQNGNVAPQWIRRPATTIRHPFRIAVDPRNSDIAILGSDGTALFRGAGREPPSRWSRETRLPARGWSIAFGAGVLVVANQFGDIEKVDPSHPNESAQAAPVSLDDPEFIATAQDGVVYTASTGGVITRLAGSEGSAAAWRSTTFATPFDRNLDAFAADSRGYFYLSSSSNDAIVTVKAGGRQGVLAGRKSELNRPLGVAVDRDGTLYVANTASNEILLFARGSSGNVAPIARISGPATQLEAPQALAIDKAGNLYVFDGPKVAGASGALHHVRVYDARASGNVAPLRSYDVRTKCWVNAL